MSAIMPTYGSPSLAFERGDGVYLYDTDGKQYLDFCTGIAVTALGHNHPHLVQAIRDQAGKLLHYSNLYQIPGQERMAQRLVDATFASSVFFCNSGAEAVECGIKIARRYHSDAGNPERNRIITATGSFHGRTLATLSAAKQEKYMTGFRPMLDGFDQVPYGNLNEVRAAITEETAAILVEPVQGEGGINYASEDYLNRLRETADEYGLLLFLDEVQTGMGRSGKLFAYQWSDIEPDILSSAKGLGGGFPVGACLANDKCSAAMVAGTHGSTFGGNPMAMAAANAVLDVILEDGFLGHVVKMGAVLRNGLDAIAAKHADKVSDVRGLGLLMGIEISGDIVNGNVVKDLEAHGLLTVGAGNNVIRLIPPLIVEESHIADALDTLDDVLTGIDA